MGAEDTPLKTMVDHRWDSPKGREDWGVYDSVYTTAELLRQSQEESEQAVGKLLILVLNEWEKLPRSVPQQVVSAALDVATAFDEKLMFNQLTAELEGMVDDHEASG